MRLVFINLAIVDAVAGRCLGTAVNNRKFSDALKELVSFNYNKSLLCYQGKGLNEL